VKKDEGTIFEPMPALWKSKTYVSCPRCGEQITPGLMNLSYHYMECKSPVTAAKKMRATNTSLLIFEIKKQVKF
jgi:hypothetical protein